MSKILKKSLSLILALILTFSVGSFAFAADTTETLEPIAKETAEIYAVEYLRYKTCSHITTEEVYSDGVYYNNKEVYKVISTVLLEDDTLITFTAYIDKYTGKIYDRNAKFWLPIATENNPLTKDEAYAYALKALCAIEEDVIVLKSEEITNDNGKAAYHFVFAENIYESHECTIEAETGFIEDIEVVKPASIVDRIVLLIRVLFAKLLGISIF